jgi:hypothetical protein
VLAGEDSKVSFKLLVETFSLAIGLWAISHQCYELNSQYAMKFMSELSDELRALI